MVYGYCLPLSHIKTTSKWTVTFLCLWLAFVRGQLPCPDVEAAEHIYSL